MANKLNTDVNKLINDAVNNLKGKAKATDVSEAVKKKSGDLAQKAKDRAEEVADKYKTEAKKKATDTVTEASKKVQDKISGINVEAEIKNAFSGSDFGFLINELLDDSIDEIVKDELDKARQNFTLSDTGQMIGTAESYYKQIFDSEKIMTDMRDDFSKHLSKSINSVVNDRLYDLQNSLGGEWGRKLLGKSKLASTITNAINKEVANVVNSVISDEVIAETSQDIIDLVTNIQSSAKEQIETQFGDEIEYAEKLQKSVEDKIELFEEQKKIYQEKLEAQVEKLQKAINEAIQKVEQIIINEISKVIKIDASSLNLGI